VWSHGAIAAPTRDRETNVATDDVIQQRLGEAPEDEAVKERLEREHGELLEELRALIPGAQVLFGFLLAIRFTSPFTDLDTVQRYVYYATLLTTAVALVFLLAPSAYHRLRFREGDKDAMVRKGNREAIAGTGAIALAFTGVLYLITDLVFTPQAAIAVAVAFSALTAWRWWAIALYRKAREQTRPSRPKVDTRPGQGHRAGGPPSIAIGR
jgi:hypothetical protein